MAEIITEQITLDISHPQQWVRIRIQQGDVNSKQIDVSITNDGDTYIIPQGSVVQLEMMKPDNFPIFNTCTVVNNNARFEISEQMTAASGLGTAKIKITDGGGTLHTVPFYIYCDEEVLNESIIVSTGEFTALTDALVQMSAYQLRFAQIGDLSLLNTESNTDLVSSNNELLNRLNQISINVKYKGLLGNGSTNDYSALNTLISSIGSSKTDLLFPTGTYVIGTSITIPSNVNLIFANGAMLSPNVGVTITINGTISANIQQIFTGSGTINGNIQVSDIYPQWFGAKGDGITCDADAINKAILLSQPDIPYMDKSVKFPCLRYLINSSIIVPHGTENRRVHLFGYGATLVAGTSGMDMIKVVSQGSPASYTNLGETKILGFRIEGVNLANRAITIGRNGDTHPYGIDGIYKSLLRDVDIRGCLQTCIEISDSRLWEFDSCTLTIDNGSCMYFNSTNGKTVTDHWITNCQMSVAANSTNNVCVKIIATGTTSSSAVGGLHFTDCVFYGQAVNCQATNSNSGFADIFFTSCASDGANSYEGYYGFYFKATNTTGSGVILIDNCWVNAHGFGVYFQNIEGGHVNGCKISSTYYQGILFIATRECSINNVKLHDVNTINNGGGSIGLADNGYRNKVIGCNIYNASGHDSQIILISSNQIKPIVTNNTTDSGVCVTNNIVGTEGVNFIVSNNL